MPTPTLDTSENAPFWCMAWEFMGRFEDDYLTGDEQVRIGFLDDAETLFGED